VWRGFGQAQSSREDQAGGGELSGPGFFAEDRRTVSSSWLTKLIFGRARAVRTWLSQAG